MESLSAGCRRTFLRLSFCANLLLSRFFSPGLRKNECRFTSLIMPSCWTCRLKRRRALSMDSPSNIRTSAKMNLRLDLRSSREYGCRVCQKQPVFSQRLAEISLFMFISEKQLISFALKLLNRDLSAGVGLQMCVELIVLFHAGFAGRACQDTGTEFLKVHTYPVEGETATAVRTSNSRQCWPSVGSSERL